MCEVFKSLSIGEKIKLSVCSKRVSTQINNARLYSQKVKVVLDMFSDKIEVHSEKSKDTFGIFIRFNTGKITDIDIQQCHIEGVTVPVTTEPTKIMTFWENYREGFLSSIRHLLKMFQCKISTDSSTYNNDFYKSIIPVLFNLQVEFKTLTIHLNGSKNDNLLWNKISSNFELVEDLRILSVANPRFIPVFISWPQNIDVFSSAWFTLKSLLTCTSTTISLWNSHLKNEDLDEVLRKWKAGGFPNLEYLLVDSLSVTNNETTILGMNLMELNGMVIQTDDGTKKATISKIDSQIIEISVTSFK
ncbi:hypothetical protein CRE_24289 [Caenorhabditis remanei]|uniref:Sdz-33 F-box domain-containing protein n=1 Tax=Caenorhabditis remanei TaxID=31234 RepID=E3NLC4_CAERE|nr:hypothetical protein CRE_24289 [Caenorhabditis remanei]